MVQAATSAQESADVFENIARALERGQQKKLLSLCQQALDEGCRPSDILSRGMIVGMNRLGEAFSANRAFVPEMLMAARCMSAAYRIRSRSWSAARPSARASATRSARITTPKTPVPLPARR